MHDLPESLLVLASELRKSRRQRKIEFEWLKSHLKLATKHDLEEMEKRMGLRISELKTEVAGIRSQVTKIWNEQQAKYDALVVKYDELVKQIEAGEVDAETSQAIVDFKNELKAFDDTIPDTTA